MHVIRPRTHPDLYNNPLIFPDFSDLSAWDSTGPFRVFVFRHDGGVMEYVLVDEHTQPSYTDAELLDIVAVIESVEVGDAQTA